MIKLTTLYDHLFKELSRSEKKSKINELKQKEDKYQTNDRRYEYYAALVNSYESKMKEETKEKIGTYTLNIIDTTGKSIP